MIDLEPTIDAPTTAPSRSLSPTLRIVALLALVALGVVLIYLALGDTGCAYASCQQPGREGLPW